MNPAYDPDWVRQVKQFQLALDLEPDQVVGPMMIRP
jgi:murein L,D-transpeptidase YcbB/YkuD